MPDMKYIDDIADEVTEGSGEDSGMDDEDSTEALFPGADARDYHIALAIESLQEELSRAPTPIQGGCLILPDILSRSPTPLAPYQPEPMLGSRAPTPAYEVDSPRARTPLFMPMSEDEDDPSDTDRSNSTSTAKPGARRAPSPHRSSRPTAKRRRIQPPPDKSLKAFANAFLDLEAEDDADEEDDGDDDDGVPTADFIDDNPIDDEPIVVVDDSDDEDVFTSQANEAERAEALAAHFHEMARQNRTVVENADSSPHDIVSRLPDSSDPDLYRFGVPRGRQMQLLDYLYRCTGVKSVFFRDRGAAGRKRPKFETVAVYVETDDLAALERAMAKHVGAYAMLSRKPVPVDVEHRVLSTLAQSTILVGRWARVRSGSSLYQGDLVFVEDESNYLVVPRLEYERLSQTPDRPPARLFDSKKCVAAGNQVQQFNKYRVWRQRLFVEGLEQRFYVPSQLTLEGIVPTGDEEQWARFDQHRGLFNGSSHHALVAPFVGPYCALQEGDRVVVVSGKHSGKAGYIVAVTTTQLRDINTQRQQLVRLAAVLERYDGATAITRSSLQMAGHPALFVPVSALRLHALAFVRPLLVGDRVVAVGGAAQGISGRIESMHHSGHVTFRPSPPMENADAAMEIQMCDVRREFRVGDVVKVNRNLRDILQGAVGFITEVCTGGFVHLYQCALPRLLSAMSSQKADCESVVDNVADEPSMYIPTTHLDFALVDDNGLAVHSSVSPSVRQELDETTREWEKMKMSTGRAYIGCEIMVAGKQAASYARKGLFGTVLGYTVKQSTETRLRKTRAQGLKDGRTSAGPDVELHVRYDGSMEGVPVKLNQVVERYSKLPLEHVMHLRGMYEIMAKHRALQKKGGVEERIEDRPLIAPKDAWFETSREPEPLGHIYGPPRDIGEATGHWLGQKNLVGKRIDIKIEGVPGCLAQYGRRVNPRVLGHEGKRGFVKIDHPLSVAEIEKKLLECRTLPMYHPAKVPPASIKPYRLTEPDASGIAHCISSVVGRVIIIGPNVHGVTDRVGHYAESVPSAPADAPLPTPIVEVRFPLTPSGERPPNEEYHLESLCRALNETLHSCDIPATDFGAPSKNGR